VRLNKKKIESQFSLNKIEISTQTLIHQIQSAPPNTVISSFPFHQLSNFLLLVYFIFYRFRSNPHQGFFWGRVLFLLNLGKGRKKYNFEGEKLDF